jgi:hypothetical protein
MKLFNLFFLLLSTYLLFHCSSTVKIPVVKSTPQGFEKFLGSGRELGLYVYKPNTTDLNTIPEWQKLIHSEVITAIRKKGYFTIVDLSNREARLKEIAYSQKMGNGKDISKELQVDVLLFVEVPNTPLYECKSFSRVSTKKVCRAYDPTGKCISYADQNYNIYTKELNYTVFARARLVNLETGENLEKSNTAPAKLTKESENSLIDCPSTLEGFNSALIVASENIASNLSPVVEAMDVPIYDNADGITNSDVKGDVKGLLSTGNKWLSTDKPNLDLAKNQWEQALSLSGGSSASAFWNLGVYHWSKGDMQTAEMNFKKSEEKGGPDWIDSTKRNVLSTFDTEKKRMMLESGK